jgi:hypothetical protein
MEATLVSLARPQETTSAAAASPSADPPAGEPPPVPERQDISDKPEAEQASPPSPDKVLSASPAPSAPPADEAARSDPPRLVSGISADRPEVPNRPAVVIRRPQPRIAQSAAPQTPPQPNYSHDKALSEFMGYSSNRH